MSQFPLPDNDWEKEQLIFFKLQLVLENLRYREIISSRIEKEIRRDIAPRFYKHILDEPQLKNDKIKKLVKESLLNDWLRMRYGKGISITYGEETA